MTIPEWDGNKVLPPIHPATPEGQEHDSLYRAPYVARLAEFVTRFATTRDRVDLIEKFLDYRNALHQAGISEGFQWINGSFVENIKQSSRRRPPEDIDVVTFFFRDESAREGYEDLFDPDITKQNFDVDGYGKELGRPLAVVTAMDIGYFHGMWSHRRVDHVWKGFIQVDLDPEEDPRLGATNPPFQRFPFGVVQYQRRHWPSDRHDHPSPESVIERIPHCEHYDY